MAKGSNLPWQMQAQNLNLQNKFDDPEMTMQNVGSRVARQNQLDRMNFFNAFRGGKGQPVRDREQVFKEYREGTQRRTEDPRGQYQRDPGQGLPSGWADQIRAQANLFPNQAVVDQSGIQPAGPNPWGTKRIQESMLGGTGAVRTGKDIVQKGSKTYQARETPTGGSYLAERPQGWTASATTGQMLGAPTEPGPEEMGMSSPQTAAEMARPVNWQHSFPGAIRGGGNTRGQTQVIRNGQLVPAFHQNLINQGIMNKGPYGGFGLNPLHPLWGDLPQQGQGSPWDYYAGMNPFDMELSNPPGQNLARQPGSFGYTGVHQQFPMFDSGGFRDMVSGLGLDPNAINQMYQNWYGNSLYENQNPINKTIPMASNLFNRQSWQPPPVMN